MWILKFSSFGTQSPEFVMNSPPDGYNLPVISNPFFVAPLLQDPRYDPVNDFAPVTMVSREQNLVVVHGARLLRKTRSFVITRGDFGQDN